VLVSDVPRAFNQRGIRERVALRKATARRRQDWRLLDEAASLRRAADIRA
jgi:hypothetical protein